MPRQRGPDKTALKVYIDNTTLARLELYMFDPVRGRREYGALSLLVNKLLVDWIDTKVKGSKLLFDIADGSD